MAEALRPGRSPASARRRRAAGVAAAAWLALAALAAAGGARSFAAAGGGAGAAQPAERRFFLVTGSARGIGRAVCEALALASTEEAPVTVIATGRDAASTEAAAASLRRGPGAEVLALGLDVADGASRARALEEVKGMLGEGSLAALVNNAGVACDLPWAPSPPGISYGDVTERTLETNFLGPMELTKSLIREGLLAGGRVIGVSSGGGHIAINKVFPHVRERFLAPSLSTQEVIEAAREFIADARAGEKELLEQNWNYSHRYGFSKLCVSAASRTLAREHPELVVHACTPGFVLTNMTVGSPANLTPEQGARVIVHLATAEEKEVLESGKFFNSELEVLSWDDARYVS